MEFSDIIQILAMVDFSTSGSTMRKTAKTLLLAPKFTEECYTQQEKSIFGYTEHIFSNLLQGYNKNGITPQLPHPQALEFE